jgi:hypothetical protein
MARRPAHMCRYGRVRHLRFSDDQSYTWWFECVGWLARVSQHEDP